jgi:hypothetical protein
MKIYYKKVLLVILCGLFSVIFTGTVFGQNMFRKVNDFDGDGKADFAVTRSENGNKYWYIWQTTNGVSVVQWGFDTDQNYAGDFDGDGKTDVAVYRKTTPGSSPNYSVYSFWLKYSQTNSYAVQYFESLTSNVTILGFQQDFDGDGKTDVGASFINMFDGRFVYILKQSLTGTPRQINLPNGHPVFRTGDMTGDGKSDIVSLNPATQNITILDYATGGTRTVPFGAAGDEYLAADFDGDGKGDLTVFRPSDNSWWWLRSSDNVVNAATFGAMGDVPVPADYDGDGRTDLAIYRSRPESTFWVYGSQNGVFALQWGVTGDSVVRY